MRNLFLACLFLIFSGSGVCLANDAAIIAVENAYIRASIPGASNSSAYMTLNNLSSNKRALIGASSSVSARIEIHEHTMTEGMMRMRQKGMVEILSQASVTFQPSGFHLMVFDLKQPLVAGESIMITLMFDDQTKVNIDFPIESIKKTKQHQH